MEGEGEILPERNEIMLTTAYGSVEGFVAVDDTLGKPVAYMEHVEVDERYRNMRSGRAHRLIALFTQTALEEGATDMQTIATHPAIIPIVTRVFGEENVVFMSDQEGVGPLELGYYETFALMNEIAQMVAQYDTARQDVPDGVRTGVRVLVDLSAPEVHERIALYTQDSE